MLTLAVRNNALEPVGEATFQASWNGALAVAGILWAAGLAVCLLQALSPVTAGVARWLLVALVAVAAVAAGWAFRMIQHNDMRGNVAAEAAALVLLGCFGPTALVFAGGAIPFMALRMRSLKTVRPDGELRIALRPMLVESGLLALASFIGLMWWVAPYTDQLASWAVAHGAHLPKVLNASLPWSVWVAAIIAGAAFVALVIAATAWWQRVVEATFIMDAADEKRRLQLADNVTSLLHDGVLNSLERVAAGQPLTDVNRARVGALSQTIRSELLGDSTPRTTARFINSLMEECSIQGVVPVVTDVVEGEPAIEVLDVFRRAARAVLANLGHAAVSEVLVNILASGESLQVTIRDEGRGFDLSKVNWSPHTSRAVFDALSSIQPPAEAIPISEPGCGTTWILRWPAESTS